MFSSFIQGYFITYLAMKMITIKRAHYESELMALKGRLESEGIHCFLKNQFTTQVMQHMATFAVELQIPSDQIDEANAIIAQIDREAAANE